MIHIIREVAVPNYNDFIYYNNLIHSCYALLGVRIIIIYFTLRIYVESVMTDGVNEIIIRAGKS